MNLKPLNIIDEVDVYPFFALAGATGAKGTPVIIAGNGWNNSDSPLNVSTTSLQGNPANTLNVNVFSPRWEIKARVRPAVVGEKPFGVTMYDTKEKNQWDYSLVYDKQRREEAQAVLSGQAVPILKKGLLLVGPFPTGSGVQDPAPGKYAIVKGTGDWGVTASGAYSATTVFGEFIGTKDNDGYAAVVINCYV